MSVTQIPEKRTYTDLSTGLFHDRPNISALLADEEWDGFCG
jgi:hypothetical protein